MRIANIVNQTRIYGPGWRTAVWVQGCNLACKGCWNKSLWPSEGGEDWDSEDLIIRLLSIETEGVTFLGGEPLQQAESLLPILKALREMGRSVFLYSGYDREELDEVQLACVEQADIVVLGRYIEELRDTGLRWRGSSNQKVEFLTNRYNLADMDGEASEFEVHLDSEGGASIIGYPPKEILHLFDE